MPRPVDAFLDHLPLPPRANFEDLRSAVEELHGRPLRFKVIRGTYLRAATGIVFDAASFTGVMVPAEDSRYYSLLSQVHELSHLIVRSAPDDWFPDDLPRPRQPSQRSRLFLRLCPRNSGEEADVDTAREELLVEEMARSLMRPLGVFADSSEEDHFG